MNHDQSVNTYNLSLDIKIWQNYEQLANQYPNIFIVYSIFPAISPYEPIS
jgi:hypothetical protein